MGARSASTPEVVLVDANVIIEAVRTRCWAAITGGLRVETVEECRSEVERGSPATISGYVPVSGAHLARMAAVRRVDNLTRARFTLVYPGADGMDRGEQDLFARARLMEEGSFVLCSPDKASVRAAVALGWGDRIWSLERLAVIVGARPNPGFREHFTERWLVGFRTQVLLEGT